MLSKIVSFLSRIVDPASRAFVAVSGTVVAVMMFLTFFDVLLRYIFNRPITGSLELTEFMMAMLVTFGLAYCALRKGHIRVDLVLMYVSRRTQRALDVLAYLVSMVFYILITWQVFLNGKSLLASKLTSSVLFIPVYPFVFLLVLGAALLVLVFLRDTMESISEVMKK